MPHPTYENMALHYLAVHRSGIAEIGRDKHMGELMKLDLFFFKTFGCLVLYVCAWVYDFHNVNTVNTYLLELAVDMCNSAL